MEARGRISSNSDRRSLQTSGVTRHGPVPALALGHSSGRGPLDLLHHPDLLETKIAAQAAEIKRLLGDNQRLASSHVVLREELAAARQEVQRLKVHMGSVQTESEIQTRALADKIARSKMNIGAGEDVRNELKQAIKEAQSMVAARQELMAKIQDANRELQKARGDIKNLPNLRSELDSLRKEHQRLRSTFEYEKGSNMEQVDELKAMEQKLILMVKEVEKLRIEVLDAEKRASAPHPYSAVYLNPDFPYPPPKQETAAFADGHTRPHAPIYHQTSSWPTTGDRRNGYESSRVVAPASSFLTSGVSASAVPSNEDAAAAKSADAAAPTNTDAAVPTSADTAAPASAGASASISGDHTAGEEKHYLADAQG